MARLIPKNQRSAPARRKRGVETDTDPSASLPKVIGTNLKSLRTQQGYSLERLAKLANVSRAMLSQIENGQSVPTILLLLKVADALDIPLGTLVSAPASRRTVVLYRSSTPVSSNSEGRFSSRALSHALEAQPRVEFYELRIAGRHRETFEARSADARENFVVITGRVELTVGDEDPVVLSEGDAATCRADVARSLRNPEPQEAVLHLVASQNCITFR